MNTIQTYKALSVVANVEQGEMIKRLIKENSILKFKMKVILKKKLKREQELIDRLEEEGIYVTFDTMGRLEIPHFHF